MIELSLTPGFSPSSCYPEKVHHAAREFEAVLLNSMLGPLEKTFSSLPGKTDDTESDQYQSMGIQALASTLAAGHGLGIGSLISKSLLKSVPAQEKTSQEVLPRRGFL